MSKVVSLIAIVGVVCGMAVGASAEGVVDLPPGAIFQDCADCPALVVIPAGTFQMGSDHLEPMRDGEARPEGPIRNVSVSKPFAAGQYEVTHGQYAVFLAETGYVPTNACVTWGGRDPVDGVNWQDPQIGDPPKDQDPVVCVDWHDAKAYTLWLSGKTGQRYRLLTEAEWEYAAKAGSKTVWPWGEDENEICRYGNVFDQSGLKEPRSATNDNAAARAAKCDDGYTHVAPVGQYEPNAFGLYDTIGNVWEWAEDCSLMLYQDGPLDGSAYQALGRCDKRAVRSGSWRSRMSRHRPSFRGRDPANLAYYIFGFRIARELN